MSSKFYTADIHFDHKNILQYCNRNFKTVEEMNDKIIDNWNKKVGRNDLVYIVGDFTLSTNPTRIQTLADNLNGKKILIKGNHDHKNPPGFEEVCDYKVVRDSVNGTTYRVVLFHYAIEFWYGAHGKDRTGKFIPTIHLHGHSHGLAGVRDNRFDVGIDCWNYEPVTLKEILNGECHRLLLDEL